MKYKLLVKPTAELDIEESMYWYENQKKGLGGKFVDAIKVKLDLVTKNPLIYQVRYKNVRWALINRFPYALHFVVEDDQVIIIAVLSTSQDPKIWDR